MPTCDPVGWIETPFASVGDAPRQGFDAAYRGTLHIDAAYSAAVDGLQAGFLVDVIWYGDQADRTLLRHDDRDVGVFALRTIDRPNPVGVTPCVVTDVGQTTVEVEGVDMVDGTPLLDLKPALTNR